MRILLITRYIAPKHAIASVRWTKLVKYMKQIDPDLHVDVFTTITRPLNYADSKSDALLKKDLCSFDSYTAIPVISYTQLLKNILTFIQKAKTPFFRPRPKSSDQPDARSEIIEPAAPQLALTILEWARMANEYLTAFKVCKSIKKTSDLNSYDCIISSYGPPWPHLAAKKLVSARSKLCWIADFRDQWARENDIPRIYRRNVKMTRKVCHQADCLLRVNDHLHLFETDNQPVFTITNGYDPDEALAPKRSDLFTLCYTGSIYVSDDLSPLFSALRDLIDEGSFPKEEIRFVYAGRNSKIVRRYGKQYSLGPLIDCVNLSRKESLKLQSESTILIMAGWNTKKEPIEWSGKMYEYMMARKPILYLMAGSLPDSLPSCKMQDLGGFCYRSVCHETDYPDLKEFLIKEYQNWKAGSNSVCDRDETYIASFSYPVVAKHMYTLLEKTVASRQKN